MKTLIAIAAAGLLAAPAAFAQEAPATAQSAAKPASVTSANPAKRSFKVGQRVPGGFVATKYAVTNPEEHGLEKPGFDQRWIKVEGNAYLINSRNDVVISVQPLKG